MVLSHYQTEPLVQARDTAIRHTTSSPDLGLSQVEVAVKDAGAEFPGQELIGWKEIETIQKSGNSCYYIEGGTAYKIQRFSEETNRYYSLMPTQTAPTLLISGTLMHRIKGIDPWQDTREKIAAGGRLSGRVLDTATGLGYTAIQAARKAKQVSTIELDPMVLEIAELNPWSQELFTRTNITRILGNSSEEILQFNDRSFSAIIHDPPVFTMAGDLYGRAFYEELYRVLQPGGRLFHYIGDPESPSGGTTTGGVIQRLTAARFNDIKRRPRAFGVAARKPDRTA